MLIFRLIHISDLHFANLPWVQNELERLLEQKKHTNPKHIKKWMKPSSFDPYVAYKLLRYTSRLPNIDGVIISGDIATSGDRHDIEAAKNIIHGDLPDDLYCEEKLPGFAFTSGQSYRPLIMMPGNHDRFSLGQLPFAKTFEAAFGDEWAILPKSHQSPSIANHPKIKCHSIKKESHTLYFIQIDLSLEDPGDASPIYFWAGQGLANEEIIAAAKNITQTAWRLPDSGTKTIVWVVHFPPNYPNIKTELQLRNSDHLIDAAIESKVNVILSGHTHKALIYSPKYPLQVICAGTGCGINPDPSIEHSFNIINISIQNSSATIESEVVTYDKYTRDFIKGNSTPVHIPSTPEKRMQLAMNNLRRKIAHPRIKKR